MLAEPRGAGSGFGDDPDDWDPTTLDIGEEDQSLGLPDDDGQSQVPYC